MIKKINTPGIIALYFVLLMFSLFCLIPFVMVISGSITTEESIRANGYTLFPASISFDAYKILFLDIKRISRAYIITICVTFVGTVCNLLVNSMAGYALSRRNLKYGKILSLYTLITMMFTGGMVPWYIVCVKILNLKDTFPALILPYMAYAWYILLLRNFFSSIPNAMYESPRIDGAGESRIFFQIMIPLAKPALATVALFASLQYWNDWWLGLMLIDDVTMQPLQLLLRTIISNVMFLQSSTNTSMMQKVSDQMPSEAIKMAVTIVTIGPIILVYPFVQKYFVKGMMVGAVKG